MLLKPNTPVLLYSNTPLRLRPSPQTESQNTIPVHESGKNHHLPWSFLKNPSSSMLFSSERSKNSAAFFPLRWA
jgi:hypothetical protein